MGRLTGAQPARLVELRREWLTIGLATDPAERPRAERAVRAAYAAAGLAPPRICVWRRSPLEGLVEAGRRLWAVGSHAKDGPLRDRLRDRLEAEVWAQARDRLSAQVWRQVESQTRTAVGAEVAAALAAPTWHQLRDEVGAEDELAWSSIAYGQHDAGWLCFYDVLDRVFAVETCRRLGGLVEMARAAGWWWPGRDVAVLTERPAWVERDRRGRLHSASGPAVRYPDGWGVWAWHGLRVPRRVIEHPEWLRAAEILAEPRAEVRRVMIDRLGVDRFVLDAGAAVVAEDELGRLLRVDLPGDEPVQVVEVSGPRPGPPGPQERGLFQRRLLRVPPWTRSPREGIAWTFQVPGHEYAPEVET